MDRSTVGGLHVHQHHHPQVEEQPGHRGHQRKSHQPQVVRLDGGAEHRRLADEPGGEGNTPHRQHRQHENRGQSRGPRRQTGIVGERRRTLLGAGYHRGHSEGGHHLHRISGHVEPHLPDACGASDQGGEDEAGMGDAGVRQHPLQIGLGDGEQGADHDRHRGEHRHRRGPILDTGAEGDGKYPGRGGEAGHLGGRCEETGDSARRPLIHVGGPHVERRRRHLEGETHDQERHSGEEDALPEQESAVEEGTHSGDRHGAGGGEGEGDPVEEHRRGERPEQEVLESGLVGVGTLPGEAGEHVQADREHLEGDEQHHQVARRRHEVRPRPGDQHQHHELGAASRLGSHQGPGHHQGERGHREHDQPGQGGERVADQHPLEELGPAVAAVLHPLPSGSHPGPEQPTRGGQPPPARPGMPLHIDQQQSHHGKGEDDLGGDGQQIHVVHALASRGRVASHQPPATSKRKSPVASQNRAESSGWRLEAGGWRITAAPRRQRHQYSRTPAPRSPWSVRCDRGPRPPRVGSDPAPAWGTRRGRSPGP